jgi:hypothetical protein
MPSFRAPFHSAPKRRHTPLLWLSRTLGLTNQTMSLVSIIPDALWHAQHPLKFGPLSLTTRMTVVRLRDGTLWVHSPIPPTSDIVDQLQRIGRIRYVVAPNKSHHLFFLDFVNAFPAAEGFVAEGLDLKRPDLARFPRVPRPEPWGSELEGFFIEGLPILNETAWFHGDTGTLILTDLLFCFSSTNRGLAALVSKLLGVYDSLAMSRTMKLAIKDKNALMRTVTPLLSFPIKRVIVAHDQIVEVDAAAKITKAFAWLR